MTAILTLENDFIRAVLHDDATADLTDKKRGINWRMGPVAFQEEGPVDLGHTWLRTERSCCEQYFGRFRAQAAGRTVRYTLLGRAGREMGTFSAEWRLNGPWLEVEIKRIAEVLPSLMFPTPIESESLVIPQGPGRLIREWSHFALRYIYRLDHHLNMRWFGGLKGDHGWMAVIHEGHEDAAACFGGMHLIPVWLKSLGRWRGSRIVRYCFTGNGYVGMAKVFRQFAREHGLFHSLEEKFERTPALGNLVGGRSVYLMQAATFARKRLMENCRPVPEHFEGKNEGVVATLTYAQAAKIMAEAKALGMKKGFFGLAGWIKGGYDESHPDIWPPEPALGSCAELAALCREPAPWPTVLHDNYMDIYAQSPSFPNGVMRLRDGLPLTGGIWSGGQAYIMSYKHSIKYAHRNWRHLKTLGLRAIYCDTTTAEPFRESWAKGDRQTRADDQEYRKRFLAFWKKQGLLLGSENGMDWGVPYTDWIANQQPVQPNNGIHVPLWSLVYHDCLFNAVTVGGGKANADFQPEPLRRQCLRNMLWGNVLGFGFSTPQDWDECKQAFASTFYVDEWLGRVATAEMTNHRFLTSDFQVEQTEFANGLAIAVNFSPAPVRADGIEVPALGYVIRE